MVGSAGREAAWLKPHWLVMVWPCDGIRAILRFPPSVHAPPGSSSRSPISGGGLRRLELSAMLQHGKHDDGKSPRERNPCLAHRRSPGNVERPVLERETGLFKHEIGVPKSSPVAGRAPRPRPRDP